MKMKITFPGGKRVDADFKGFTHKTDQPKTAGGDNSAPTPFDLFLASLGTCAGIYVVGFCQHRGIDYQDIEIEQTMSVNPGSRLIESVELAIHLPDDFPEKYHSAIIQSVNQCTVKRHLENPPRFDVRVV